MAKEFLKNFSRILQEFQKRFLKEEEATGNKNKIANINCVGKYDKGT